jgi:putative proteasome-type protease
MHRFTELGGRFFTLLSAGNLATTQAVVARLNRDLRENAEASLQTVNRMREAADYVGSVSKAIQARYPEAERTPGFSPDADFIFGGQIGAAKHELFQVYSQGNYFSPDERSPFLQIGEQKYGKPILDRIIEKDTSLATVALCGLVSMDSTMRSNASVGPPIELLIYRAGLASSYSHLVYGETDPYLLRIRESWAENLRLAFEKLPPISLPPSKVRLVDR